MRQQAFEQQHGELWQRIDSQLQQLERRQTPEDAARFPARYRQLCRQLALAEARHYSPALIARLQQLVLRGQRQLYRPPLGSGLRLAGFVASGFPRCVRQHWRYLAMASALFYLPLLLCALLVYCYPDLVHQLLDQQHISHIEQMYDPKLHRLGPLGEGSERSSGDDWLMFGFYVMNNIGVAFQTFIGGLPFGLGTLFFLLSNGVSIGATAGHLLQGDTASIFLGFVVGHSAFELTAITLAGAAGLLLASALLLPGRLTRSAALLAHGRSAVQLLGGAVLMLLLAAFTEAYWSSINSFPAGVKYLVGSLLWLLVGLYFLRAGRTPEAVDD